MPQAPDDESTLLVNQKFDEVLLRETMIYAEDDPREVAKRILSEVRVFMRSLGRDFLDPSGSHLDHIVAVVRTKQLQHLCSRQFHVFIAENMSPSARNMKAMDARPAVENALGRLTDWCRSRGYPVEGIGVSSEEEFEKLVSSVEKLAERYRMEQERGATPLGQGVYAEVVSDEEYAELAKKASQGDAI